MRRAAVAQFSEHCSVGWKRALSPLTRGAAAFGRLPGRVRIVAAGALAVVIAAGAAAVVLVAVSGPAPLVDGTAQGGLIACAPTPSKPDVLNWNTAIRLGENYFYDRSSLPLTVESVSLIDPHNAVLRGAMVYEMAHYRNAVGMGGAWADEPAGVTLAAWRYHHQPVPGAVIEPLGVRPPVPDQRGNIYQVLLGVSARTPHGAWIAGFRVTYSAQGRTYTVATYEGLAIAANDPAGAACGGLTQAIQNDWAAHKIG
jgi:hypothetical protein